MKSPLVGYERRGRGGQKNPRSCTFVPASSGRSRQGTGVLGLAALPLRDRGGREEIMARLQAALSVRVEANIFWRSVVLALSVGTALLVQPAGAVAQMSLPISCGQTLSGSITTPGQVENYSFLADPP